MKDNKEKKDLVPEAEPEEAALASEEAIIEEETSSEDELSAEKDKYLRLAAEYDNYRKRSQKERENIYADVRADTINQLLPVYDNLIRACAQETEDDAYKKGVDMILIQFEEIMEKMGIKPIAALGETFDPQLHDAVMHIDDDEKGEGEIVEEFQKGFIMGDKVIRFSMVKVAN